MKTILRAVLLTLLLNPVGADPIEAFRHAENPAYLGVSSRQFFNLGFNLAEIQATNNYLNFPQILDLALSARTFTLDMDALVAAVGEGGFQYAFGLDNDIFLTLQLGSLGLGTFVEQQTHFSNNLPLSLFSVLADGLKPDQVISGRSDIWFQSAVRAGLYGAWRWQGYNIAVKLAAYAPLAILDQSSVTYEAVVTSGGTIKVQGQAQIQVLSNLPVDLLVDDQGNLNTSSLTSDQLSQALSKSGFVTDLGFVYQHPRTKKTLYGAALRNIPIAPLFVPVLALNANYSWEGENALMNYENPDFYDPVQTTSWSVLEETRAVLLPLELGGFYRLPLLPFFDLVLHADMAFWNPFRFKGGVTGSLFLGDFIGLDLNLSRQDFTWDASLTGRINLRVIELDAGFGTQGPDLASMFLFRGARGHLRLAFGL